MSKAKNWIVQPAGDGTFCVYNQLATAYKGFELHSQQAAAGLRRLLQAYEIQSQHLELLIAKVKGLQYLIKSNKRAARLLATASEAAPAKKKTARKGKSTK